MAEYSVETIRTDVATDRCFGDMKRKTFLAIVLGAAFGLIPNIPLTQAADSTNAHGLAIGAKAPEFKLKDQEGKERALAEFQKKAKFVALVFYRSADW
jgi:cytochrome oxidase Cu insertion factor (SCO1/SenC/PrrC family)